MSGFLELEILPQPDETTCGPTCLHCLYAYHGETLDLDSVIGEVPSFAGGGTLGAMLGCHALERGYRVVVYSYNLRIFDPSWFHLSAAELAERLDRQRSVRDNAKLKLACDAYARFLRLGGEIRFDELTGGLLQRHLGRGQPLIAGLSATYLYGTPRELPNGSYDDLRGESTGHFVVLSGYDHASRQVQVLDPLQPNPVGGHSYGVGLSRLVASILLGVLTYDANLLLLEPQGSPLK